jgi:hypothetical protein
MSDPHLGFIIAAYVLGLTVILGMVGVILYDNISLKRALSKFSPRDTLREDS